MLNNEINCLINYSIINKFLPSNQKDIFINSSFNKKYKLINKLLDIKNEDYNLMWKKVIDYMQFDSILEQDIFTDELSSKIIGDNDYIEKIFYSFKNNELAMEWYEKLSEFTTYIKRDRIKKNIIFKNDKYIVSFNKSKPEKTLEQIKQAAMNTSKLSVLSIRQVGLKGSASQNPRMAHRVINLPFGNNKWFIQYSPYQYFNKHSILVSKNEERMKINEESIETILDFLDFLPSFNISLNADLPIVGGSILNHMHFQTGQFEFPIYKSKKEEIKENIYFLDWPIATILIESKDRKKVLTESNKIIKLWKNYSPEDQKSIFSKDHNTISLSGRFHKNKYQVYIILRNNYTNKKYPDGLFHVPKEYQVIKKENIGVIEACGLGIFPGRLDFSLVQKIQDEDFLKWKANIGNFNSKEEYQNKILKTFEIILYNCNPLRIENIKKDFLKKVI